MTIPIYVVIPVKNQLHYTQGIVKQLLEQGEAKRIFVVDNGSTDGTIEWLKSVEYEHRDRFMPMWDPGSTIHQMWNWGLENADFEAGPPRSQVFWTTPRNPHDVAILNNDLRIGPRFLSSLQRVLRSDPSVGLVGANYDGRDFAPFDAQEVNQICAGRYDGTGGLPGFAFMLKGEDGYRFPEDLAWWCGDNDLLLTVLSQGRRALLVRDAVCEHLDGGGGTGNWEDPEIKAQCQQDIAAFRAKWAPRLASSA